MYEIIKKFGGLNHPLSPETPETEFSGIAGVWAIKADVLPPRTEGSGGAALASLRRRFPSPLLHPCVNEPQNLHGGLVSLHVAHVDL